MVLGFLNSELTLTHVPDNLDEFLNHYIDKTKSVDFATQPVKSVKSTDGKCEFIQVSSASESYQTNLIISDDFSIKSVQIF